MRARRVSWLREFTDLPESDHARGAARRARAGRGSRRRTSTSFDVTGPVVVGQVVSFEDEPQSNGKTIRWCQVDVGGGRRTESAASSAVRATSWSGDKVAVTLPGAVLPGPFPISARKTYGHTSDGMIASAKELGLGDEHDGILRLAALGLDPEVGVDAIPLLGLDDFAVEVNVTPDRGYAFSIRGIAREYSNSTGAAFRDPGGSRGKVAEASGFPVVLQDDRAPIRGRAGCSVFTARVVRGVNATWPTPPWMVARLLLSGVRSISLIVDIGNYVMLELGQPIHTYDLAKVDPGGLVIRRAVPGRPSRRSTARCARLDPEDLVVADATGAIGLAGVMGGASTEISATSTDVLVEAGNWDPITIARSVRRHKLPSEAAKRYERGVDPRMSDVAAARVVDLLVELGGGTADPLGFYQDDSIAPAADRARLRLREPAHGRRLHRGRDRRVADRDRRDGRSQRIRLDGHAADLAARPDRRPHPGRGGRPHRRLRPHPVRAARRAARPWSHPRPAPASQCRAGTRRCRPRPRCWRTRSCRSSENDRFGGAEQAGAGAIRLANALDPDAANAAHHARSRASSRSPAATCRAASPTSRSTRSGSRSSPSRASPTGAARCRSATRRPDEAALDALRASIPPQPWHVGALLVGDARRQAARSGRRADRARPTRSMSPGSSRLRWMRRCASSPERHQALHPGRTAGAVVRGAAGRHRRRAAASLAARARPPARRRAARARPGCAHRGRRDRASRAADLGDARGHAATSRSSSPHGHPRPARCGTRWSPAAASCSSTSRSSTTTGVRAFRTARSR